MHAHARAPTISMYPMKKTRASIRREDADCPGRDGRRVQVRRSGVHGKGVFALRAIRAGETIIEYTGERISWKEALRRHPHDPAQPNHTFYFHIDDKHVIDANVGGNAARWINHACDTNCEADEVDGRVFIKALRDVQPGRGAVLRLRPGDRRAPDAEAEEGVSLPLRQRQLPRHAAGAEEALNPGRSADARQPTPALGRRGAVARARPLLPGLSVEVVASADSTNTRLLERARISSGRRNAPVTTPGELESAHAPWDTPTPHGRRNDDTQPLSAGGRTADQRPRPPRPRLAFQRRCLADLFAGPAAAPARLVGPVAGRGPGLGRCAGSAGRRQRRCASA